MRARSTLERSPSTSGACARRSKATPRTRATSRQCSVSATGSRRDRVRGRRVAEHARRGDPVRAGATELSAGVLKARAPMTGPSELAHVGEAFNTMASNIEALFDARRQLVAWASHDLRTPVTSIQAMLEALEDRLATTDEYLPALREQTQTLATLIDDLFELARIDASVLTLELRETQLPQLVSTCVSGLEAEARARQVHLDSRMEGV